MNIKGKEVKEYLELVKNLSKSYLLLDIHVHPFDVILNQFKYHPNPVDQGVYSIDDSKFSPPQLSTISLKSETFINEISDESLYNRLLLMKIKIWYAHTGPKVFLSHMNLCGIDKILLLPVAPNTGDIEAQMIAMVSMFGNNNQFIMGSSIPNSIRNEEIGEFLKRIIDQFNIKAIKLHPNLTEINVSSNFGKERIERILYACREFELPIIVHGGISSILRNQTIAAYSTIENLENLNWSISRETVVIAHAGSHECDLKHMKEIILPRLRKMLQSHSNLMIDISGLGFNALITVLRNIDIDRIIFGSDALYYTQWSTVVKLLHALKETHKDIEENFIKIISVNPLRTVFKRQQNLNDKLD